MASTLHRLPRWRVTLAVPVAWSTYGALSARVSFHHPDLIRSLLGG